ncbi:hypothetical protein U27_02310 [Candidatus Vecturithrix granuli]|uniref:Uncharacterized protein n=1 Tax=Vecturithrix granuli TaxID=1499967 RepID=A0A0S6WAQ7_VECG1|nr:hypothetical protein U27_02310 [Candidatus Vecturithrix granuli]
MCIKISRWLSLVFRYGTLILLGMNIAGLWKICQLDHYDSWGKFYAIWIPLLYALCSSAYLLLDEKIHLPAFRRFLSYDDYTYLFSLGFLGLQVAGPYLKNFLLCFAVVYVALIVLKGGLFLAYLAAHIRQLPGQEFSHARLPLYFKLSLLLTALAVYTLISVYHIQRTSLTGDEPHYLLITHSLWHDHDTNLYNNYRDRDYKTFFWDDLRPAWGDQVSETEIYSYRHKGGFPFVLLPGYVLGGQFGAVFQMNLITALLMLQVFLLTYELFHSLMASFLTWICTAFSIPMIIYMGQIYPEPLAALMSIWVVRRIRIFHLPETLRDFRFWKNSVMIGGCLLLIVLLKTRYVPIAGTMALFLLFHLFQKRLGVRQKFKITLIVTSIIFVNILFAVLIDSRISDSTFMLWFLRGYNPLYGVLGGLFDQEYGLFFYTPLYMLACVGLGLLTRQEWRDVLSIAAIVIFNYVFICLWPLWHAAPTPPLRYFLPILPLLAVFLAKFFAQKSSVIKSILFGVCALWSGLLAWTITINPWWRYNWADGTNNFLEAFSRNLAVNLPRLFPSWIRVNPAAPYLTLAGILGIGALIYACRVETKGAFSFLQKFTPDLHIFLIIISVISLGFVGLALGKILPSRLMEAEDALDVSVSGGKRVPETLDPWNNQLYIREWKFFGWQLNPGDQLEVRPKLYHSLPSSKDGQPVEWELHIYARAVFDADDRERSLAMGIFVNGKPVAQTTVTETGWKIYTFHLFMEEQRPLIAVRNQESQNSQRALIIDKLRFQ